MESDSLSARRHHCRTLNKLQNNSCNPAAGFCTCLPRRFSPFVFCVHMFRPVACAAVGSLPAVQNPKHLLIFAAGNDGEIVRSTCTVGSPAIGKNVLSVGASSSGDSRWTFTGEDGLARTSILEAGADIDTVAYFSSYGPTTDDRIKPELVAPGDGVRAWGLCTGQSGLARIRSFFVSRAVCTGASP